MNTTIHKHKHRTFTAQLPIDDFQKMEVLRNGLGMKRSAFIKHLLKMFCLAYPDSGRQSDDKNTST